MTKRIEFDLIDRYLSGEVTAAEASEVERRAAIDPDVRALLEELRTPTPSVTSWDVDAGWSRFRRARAVRRATPRYLAAAAAAVLLVTAGVVTARRIKERAGTLPASVASQEYRAEPGAARVVDLADGSRVTLAGSSVVRVPVSYPAVRDVHLEGEAFFQVTADAARPFTVHARGTTTRVLGTSFNVAAWAEESAVEVVVVTGRVLLTGEAGSGSANLAAGQLGRAVRSGAVDVEPVADVAAHTDWTEGRLTFRDVAFADVARRLERWFDTDIEIADSALAHTHVSAQFERQTLPDVLDVLATTLDAHYEQQGRRVVFHLRK